MHPSYTLSSPLKRALLLIFPFLLISIPALAENIPPHPRLLVTNADWNNLPARMENDPIVKNIVNTTIARADATIDKPLLERTMTGRRLLSISRGAIQYTLDLSAAYKITGNKKYLTRATAELLNVCSFSDWNPAHHLDTAEMQAAVAIGYDWLYNDLSPEDRKTISTALFEKGLNTSLEHDFIFTRINNWNQVCNGGVTLSAIALMSLHPETSAKALNLVRKSIPIALKESYSSNGAYAEGGGYWSYGTEYSMITHQAFLAAKLPEPGIITYPGFLESADFLNHVYGTSGKLFNYGDNGAGPIGPVVAAAWIAGQTKNANLQKLITPKFLATDPNSFSRYHILAAFWFPDPSMPKPKKLNNHFTCSGKSPIAIHRTGFELSDLFLGIKAGKANVVHGHMDAGSFVIDWQGQR